MDPSTRPVGGVVTTYLAARTDLAGVLAWEQLRHAVEDAVGAAVRAHPQRRWSSPATRRPPAAPGEQGARQSATCAGARGYSNQEDFKGSRRAAVRLPRDHRRGAKRGSGWLRTTSATVAASALTPPSVTSFSCSFSVNDAT